MLRGLHVAAPSGRTELRHSFACEGTHWRELHSATSERRGASGMLTRGRGVRLWMPAVAGMAAILTAAPAPASIREALLGAQVQQAWALQQPATPIGTTYTVHHQVGRDPDGPGGDPPICVAIFNPGLPGAPDDLVTFDGVPEAIRTDFFGTVPTVNESVSVSPQGFFIINVETSAPLGRDLFPPGITDGQGGPLLTDACFLIGPEDPLDWPGVDTVLAATITFFQGTQVVAGPTNISDHFSNPWDGNLRYVRPASTGLGINRVLLEVIVTKDVEAVNDDCVDAITVSNGSHLFSSVGATTDGPDEPGVCNKSGYTQVGSDIWYEYTATCTGDITVDTCTGTLYDSKLAVYPGCGTCPPTDEPVACSDDADNCGPSGRQSRVNFPATAGSCYTIRVGGFQGDQGPGTLRINCAPGACCSPEGTCQDSLTRPACLDGGGQWFPQQVCSGFTCPPPPPVNDLCENAIEVFTGVNEPGFTGTATGEDITQLCGLNDHKDVWHLWEADCTGRAAFGVCDSGFDTTLALFDGCEGTELACSDDDCSATRSRVTYDVTVGEVYYIRVSGHNGATGTYNLLVEPCVPVTGACCRFGGSLCQNGTQAQCAAAGGIHQGDGSACLADQNGNGIDDACEGCAPAAIVTENPPRGLVDARQPHASGSELPRQGIGASGGVGVVREPIVVVLDPPLTNAQNCFSLCESAEDALLGPNAINVVTHVGGGAYEIVLERPITAFAATTIRYDGGAGSNITYFSHPANVSGDSTAAPGDILEVIDCCLNRICPPAWDDYSCDVDRSGVVAPADILMVIDLLNGAGPFVPANGTTLASPPPCP